MRTEPGTRKCGVHVTLAAVPTAPGLARSFVRHTLRAWRLGRLLDDAELVASELVTNAVKAATAPAPADLRSTPLVVVELRADGDVLRIAVKDSDRGRPALQEAADDAEGGRGLFLVQALSARWDVSPAPDGKVTWAELPLG